MSVTTEREAQTLTVVIEIIDLWKNAINDIYEIIQLTEVRVKGKYMFTFYAESLIHSVSNVDCKKV